jgi:hypothetical protein
MPQFFETDFTVSAWFSDRGQIEESNGLPIHQQDRTVLLGERRNEILRDFRPYSLEELVVTATVSPALKYAWLAEETWTRKLSVKDIDHEKDAAAPQPGEVDIEAISDAAPDASDHEHSNSDGDAN